MAPSYTNGRRGPNVSHFLRDLNTVADKPLDEPEFTFEDDLAMFTNTQFFDYETGQNTDYQAHPIKHEMDSAPSSAVSPTAAELTSPAMNDMSNLDFMSGEFSVRFGLFFLASFEFDRFLQALGDPGPAPDRVTQSTGLV